MLSIFISAALNHPQSLLIIAHKPLKKRRCREASHQLRPSESVAQSCRKNRFLAGLRKKESR
jgi:hypothetical protein